MGTVRVTTTPSHYHTIPCNIIPNHTITYHTIPYQNEPYHTTIRNYIHLYFLHYHHRKHTKTTFDYQKGPQDVLTSHPHIPSSLLLLSPLDFPSLPFLLPIPIPILIPLSHSSSPFLPPTPPHVPPCPSVEPIPGNLNQLGHMEAPHSPHSPHFHQLSVSSAQTHSWTSPPLLFSLFLPISPTLFCLCQLFTSIQLLLFFPQIYLHKMHSLLCISFQSFLWPITIFQCVQSLQSLLQNFDINLVHKSSRRTMPRFCSIITSWNYQTTR